MKPYFHSFNEFIIMGGHGWYVWLCYGITLFAVLGLIVYIKNERNRTIHKLSRPQTQTRLTNKQRRNH